MCCWREKTITSFSSSSLPLSHWPPSHYYYCVCVFCRYCIHWMRITIGKITEIHFNSIPFVFLVLFYLFLVFFLSFHFDLNIQWQGDDERTEKTTTINPSMDAYGNLTLGMGIKMQFKSICLFVCLRYEAETAKHANEYEQNSQLKRAVSGGEKKTETSTQKNFIKMGKDKVIIYSDRISFVFCLFSILLNEEEKNNKKRPIRFTRLKCVFSQEKCWFFPISSDKIICESEQKGQSFERNTERKWLFLSWMEN